MSEKINIKILVAPLDWGLGHATRCIPIITHLEQLGCKVIIGAEGVQAKLLKKEFPHLDFVNLPGYRIKYSKSRLFFALKILMQLPKIFLAIKKENKWLKNFVTHTPVNAIISDNRYGLYLTETPSVFVTHQLLIKAPLLAIEQLLQKLNYFLINRFSTCWIPDEKGTINLAGKLSHPGKLPAIPLQYLGGLSRLHLHQGFEKKYDLLIILSGPEPQRSVLEMKILSELQRYDGPVLLVRGLPGIEKVITAKHNITVQNHLAAKDLEIAFCESDLIISRSGYTTIMDIFKLKRKAVLIPTPGQTEQEYLAKHLEEQDWAVSMDQQDFDLNKLLHRVQHFEYKLPQLDMEGYKDVVTTFVWNIKRT
ncbi:MAG: glycosyltransferase [Segetibacter sp.]